MRDCGAPRFQEPAEEPLSPKRKGRFEIEEISLSTENGKFRFFNHPEIGAIRCSLAVDYEIAEGEDTAVTDKWFWKCPDNGTWEPMDHPELEIAADDLLEKDRSLKASFERWVAENSEEVLPRAMTLREIEMRAA